MVKPLREVAIKMKFKVQADQNYKIFLNEVETILKQMEGVVSNNLEALCQSESMDKSTLKAEELNEIVARFHTQTGLLKHHVAGAKSAANRFSGILGLDMSKETKQ